MNEEIQMMMEETTEGMDKAIDHLQSELLKIRAGKANPTMLNGIMIEAYGVSTPLNQLANLSTPDARTITIQPFDKNILNDIEKGIMQSNIGLTPQNDGEFIRLNIPPLTEERRKGLVKQARQEAENARISLRSVRKDAMDFVKSLQKDGLSEDMAKTKEEDIQKLTNQYAHKVDQIVQKKEEEILTV